MAMAAMAQIIGNTIFQSGNFAAANMGILPVIPGWAYDSERMEVFVVSFESLNPFGSQRT
jgi:hypothetical protein